MKTASKVRLFRNGHRIDHPRSGLSEKDILNLERLAIEPEELFGWTTISGQFCLGDLKPTTIDVFICLPRDVYHMRGLRSVQKDFPIAEICDSDVPGISIDSSEYQDYMALRREIGHRKIESFTECLGFAWR
jgi:hypothetical protein